MSEYIIADEFGVIAKWKDAPTEIVRCRDCKYGYEVYWTKSWDVPPDYRDCGGKLTAKWDYYNDEPQSNPVPPDGFCAWGERKSE